MQGVNKLKNKIALNIRTYKIELTIYGSEQLQTEIKWGGFNMNDNVIRVATIGDAEKLLEIYAPYITDTAITFEYTIPSVEGFQRRICQVLCKFPYLVAERNGEIVGYAYASSFHERAAYEWAVETTVYVRKDKKKMGIGKDLYMSLEKALKLQNILNLNACISYSELEDEYLTKDSVQFHKHLGYQFVGEFHKCGFKFQRWYNVIWMEKHLGTHMQNPLIVKRFDEIKDIFYKEMDFRER